MRLQYIKEAWLVLVLGVFFGGALAGVHYQLGDRISRNKLADTLSQVPMLVSGSADSEPAQVGGMLVYRAMDEAGQTLGWVLPAGGPGFADRLELLIGLDARAEKITGLYVLDQKETPGLGNRIVEQIWRGQFKGTQTDRAIKLVKTAPGENQVQAITGATISSQSVTDIVNRSVRDFRAAMDEANK